MQSTGETPKTVTTRVPTAAIGSGTDANAGRTTEGVVAEAMPTTDTLQPTVNELLPSPPGRHTRSRRGALSMRGVAGKRGGRGKN